MKKISDIRKKSLTEGKVNLEAAGDKISIDGIDKKYGEHIGLNILHEIKNSEYMNNFKNKKIEVSIKIK